MVIAEAPSLVDRAASLAREFATRAAEHDRDASFPFENFAALRAAGLLSLTVPAEFGGAEAGLAEVCRVVQEVAKGDASTALVLAMQYIYISGLARGRRSPVRERVLREVVEQGAMVNTMRVEPELGTPSRGGLPATTATETTNGWRISGHKIYATGSPMLSYFFVWARTTGDNPRVGSFLVPRNARGVEVIETWDQMGMRATGSHDLLLHEVEIPSDYALDLRLPAQWQPPDPATGVWNGVVLSALYHGVACAARDWLLAYLHERVPANLGASLATLPRFQTATGEIQALLYTNERLIYGLAAEIDREGPAGASPRASLVKYVSTNNAVLAVDIALGLVGNPGLSRAHPLERHHRDVLCSRIHTPQDDMVLLAAGKSALGIVP